MKNYASNAKKVSAQLFRSPNGVALTGGAYAYSIADFLQDVKGRIRILLFGFAGMLVARGSNPYMILYCLNIFRGGAVIVLLEGAGKCKYVGKPGGDCRIRHGIPTLKMLCRPFHTDAVQIFFGGGARLLLEDLREISFADMQLCRDIRNGNAIGIVVVHYTDRRSDIGIHDVNASAGMIHQHAEDLPYDAA